MRICGIYKITNTSNGKVYIGSSINTLQRWAAHKSHCRKNKHCNRHLQGAWNEYGEKSFQFSIIDECNENLLLTQEDLWINYYDSRNQEKGYNLASANRVEWSAESRLKASLSHMGSKNAHFGKGHSVEAMQKIMDANVGRKHTEEWKAQHSKDIKGNKNLLGYRFSEESKKKMSESRKNRPPPSIETCRKISENKKRYWENKRLDKLINSSTNLKSLDALHPKTLPRTSST